MQHLKTRLLALLMIIGGVGLVYYNWYDLHHAGKYSVKVAAFGPAVVIGGIFLLLFPAQAGKPTTTQEKIVTLGVFGIGFVVGLVNWYLMAPGFFGR